MKCSFPQILLPIAETCIRNASFEYILISVVYKNLERKIKEMERKSLSFL